MKPNSSSPSMGALPDLRHSRPPRQSSAISTLNVENDIFFQELYAAEVAVQRCQQSDEHERVARRIFDFLRVNE